MKVQLISPLEPSDPFLAELARLESHLPAAERPWLRAVRRRALARFGERGFPGRRDEDWKYTDVSNIAERPLRVALPGVGPLGTGAAGAEAGRIEAGEWRYAGLECLELVFVNGHCVSTSADVNNFITLGRCRRARASPRSPRCSRTRPPCSAVLSNGWRMRPPMRSPR